MVVDEQQRRRLDRLDGRPSPEQMLERVRREAGAGARGRHRVYLGMAPGVGKTFTALEQLHRQRARGTEAMIGLVETHGRPRTAAMIGDLAVVPRRQIPYGGVVLEEMDTQALIRRHPAVALVDELAHTNAPGSRRTKRWQDVEDLLEAGITVISTVNIQHLESLADIVESITGIHVRERIPDHVLADADEVELVDLSAHALRQRMRRGNVYPPERAKQALSQFFREGNLTALRQLALRKVAAHCEQALERYMRHHAIDAAWAAGERVMVGVDDQSQAQHLLRRGWRLARGCHTDLLAVFVETPAWTQARSEAQHALEENLRFAEDLGAECVRVQDAEVARGLLRVAHDYNVGSLVIGPSRHGRLHKLLNRSTVDALLRRARDVDLHVGAARTRR
jgi:two-component system, OmpR family, sensor histidine kinase KdpD